MHVQKCSEYSFLMFKSVGVIHRFPIARMFIFIGEF
jgi:hypothetical protein